MQFEMVDEFADDALLAELIERFNATLISTANTTHYAGALGMQVQIGEDDFFPLPHIWLHVPVHKAELSGPVRAAMFAKSLHRMSAEECRAVGGRASQYEPEEFMNWVRQAFIEQKRRMQA